MPTVASAPGSVKGFELFLLGRLRGQLRTSSDRVPCAWDGQNRRSAAKISVTRPFARRLGPVQPRRPYSQRSRCLATNTQSVDSRDNGLAVVSACRRGPRHVLGERHGCRFYRPACSDRAGACSSANDAEGHTFLRRAELSVREAVTPKIAAKAALRDGNIALYESPGSGRCCSPVLLTGSFQPETSGASVVSAELVAPRLFPMPASPDH